MWGTDQGLGWPGARRSLGFFGRCRAGGGRGARALSHLGLAQTRPRRFRRGAQPSGGKWGWRAVQMDGQTVDGWKCEEALPAGSSVPVH